MVQLIPMIISLPLVVFWIWMFRDLINNDYLPNDSKNNWLVAFILLNVFAAGWYYYVEYRNRNL
jgi:hypothetical protein